MSLCPSAETDSLPCSYGLNAALKFHWNWQRMESEAFLLSGFSSRLFTVLMEDESKKEESSKARTAGQK